MAKNRISAAKSDDGFEYYLHPKYDRTVFRGTTINDRRINLIGKPYTQHVPASSRGPETTIEWEAATQEDLRTFYNQGNQSLVLRRNANTSSDSPDE
jgi:hypothetical protein